MNKTANYRLTIIVPVYNEEGNIRRLEKELGDFLKIARISSCVLFVNDGSKDQSGKLLKDICHGHPDFYYLELAKNGGLSAAMALTIVILNLSDTLMLICRPPRKISICCLHT